MFTYPEKERDTVRQVLNHIREVERLNDEIRRLLNIMGLELEIEKGKLIANQKEILKKHGL